MTTIERGFHPWTRLVRRLGRISPHRQVQLLCLISVVIVSVIVGTVLVALDPTRGALNRSNEGLVPAIEQLDRARAFYNRAASESPSLINPDVGVRNEAVTRLTSLNASGDTAWKRYLKISIGLPGERALQKKFKKDLAAGFDAGLSLVSDPTSTTGLVNMTAQTDAMRLDLNQLKEIYEHRVQQSLQDASVQVDATELKILLASGVALLIMLITFGTAARSARAREERVEALDRELHEDAERNELEARMQRALEMAHSEEASYELVSRALSTTVPDVPAELLVADSSRAHFHQATANDAYRGGGCRVMSPNDCPAATWGQTQIWSSSVALDACPYLQSRPEGACSAVCVPVSIGGKTVGVVHATAPDHLPPAAPVVAKLELIGRKVGERVGMQRAFKRSETQAHTDPLTGLMNRRSLEEKVRALTEEGLSYVTVYADLDHFKKLNDVHGHDAGDQALRLFARVMRESVRPHDLTARYGGEEFVMVLPDCQISDAFAVINRLREHLATLQSNTNLPVFTASFGVTAARPENTFSQTLEVADGALLRAKAAGRDRIIIAGPEAAPVSTDETAPVDPSFRGDLTPSEGGQLSPKAVETSS
jgi:diguanylate cyclase (GGDEF)-like protein